MHYDYKIGMCKCRRIWEFSSICFSTICLWLYIFLLVWGCVSFKLDLGDVINGKWMFCTQNLLKFNDLHIHNKYFHKAICFKKMQQSNYFLTNLTHGLSGNNVVHFYAPHFFSCRWLPIKWVLVLLLGIPIHSSAFIFYCVIYLYNHEVL